MNNLNDLPAYSTLSHSTRNTSHQKHFYKDTTWRGGYAVYQIVVSPWGSFP